MLHGRSKRLCAPDDYILPHYLAQSDCLAVDRQDQGDTKIDTNAICYP
jgi:hypothetical protein